MLIENLRNKKLGIFIVLVIVCKINFAQIENDSIINWSKKRQLSWQDFMGIIPDSLDACKDVAICSSGVYLYRSQYSKPTDFVVKVQFSKKESWKKKEANATLLIHEQMHFNISEIIGRRERRSIKKLKEQNVSNTNDYINQHRLLIEELDLLQDNYDKETNHGTNLIMQEKWNKWILTELDKLSEFEASYDKAEDE